MKDSVSKEKRRFYNRLNTKRHRAKLIAENEAREKYKRDQLRKQMIKEGLTVKF